MRTLTTLAQWALSIGERMNNVERRYAVNGMFTIMLHNENTDPALASLKAAIESFIAMYPWQGEKLPFHTQEEANGYELSEGELVIQDSFDPPRKIVLFEIAPKMHNLRKGQLYAYEQFLAKIAKELAASTPPHLAKEVRSFIDVRSGTSFPT